MGFYFPASPETEMIYKVCVLSLFNNQLQPRLDRSAKVSFLGCSEGRGKGSIPYDSTSDRITRNVEKHMIYIYKEKQTQTIFSQGARRSTICYVCSWLKKKEEKKLVWQDLLLQKESC